MDTELVSRDPQLLKGVLPLLVLALLAEEESYGYELVNRLQATGLHGIATGTVYPVLSRLEREGWLGSRLVASDAGPARKYYHPTAAGLRHRDVSQAAWESLVEVVGRTLSPNEGVPVTLSLPDRWSRYWYLQHLELRLDWMPGRRRRAVLRELRDGLELAASEKGMPTALAELGRPAELAAGYREAEPGVQPRWLTGSLAASAVFAAWLYGTLFYTVGLLDALNSTGTAVPASGSFLGTRVRATFNADEISAAFTGVPWAPMLVVLITFLLVSRSWNLLRRHTAALA